jgi:hypothetical protein
MAMTSKEEERSWGELTSEERLQRRIDAWLAAPGLEFASAQAEAEYKARINNFLDAVTLRNPSLSTGD